LTQAVNPTYFADWPGICLRAAQCIYADVVEQTRDANDNEDASVATAAGSHSVAADPVKNQVCVPGNQSATTLCGGLNGCIAVFTATNDRAAEKLRRP